MESTKLKKLIWDVGERITNINVNTQNNEISIIKLRIANEELSKSKTELAEILYDLKSMDTAKEDE